MANKHDVLKLLAKGLTPRQVAEELGCMAEYVRAVKAREHGNGKEIYRRCNRRRVAQLMSDPHQHALHLQKRRERYASNAAYRAKCAAYVRKYRRRKCEEARA